MSRLNYPINGLYQNCKAELEESINQLSSALSDSVLDIPAGFIHKNYLNDLNASIRKYYDEINYLDSKIQNTDKNFSILSDNLEESIKRIEFFKIEKREGLME